MIRKLLIYLGIIKPFNHNPEDFILKIEPTWFSRDYVNFKYSANGGRNWKYIYNAAPPFLGDLDYDWSWEKLDYSLGNGNFYYEKEQFGSYQKILDFTKNEEKIYNNGVLDVKNQRDKRVQKRNEAMKNANS